MTGVVAIGATATVLLCSLVLTLLREVRQRTQREIQLRSSERRLRDFAELSSDWFWEQNSELRFTYVGSGNPLLHRDSQEHIGKLRWEMNDISRAPEQWARHIEDVTHHRPFRDFCYDRLGPDGKVRYVSISGLPVHDDTGAFIGYRGTGRDITAEMEAQADLREAKERAEQAETLLRDAVDSISEGFVIYDRDDRFVMCNDVYRRMYAPVAELFVPGTPYEVIVTEWFSRGGDATASRNAEQVLAARLRQRRKAASNIEQRLNDGRCVLLTDRVMNNGGIAALRIDITRLKEAQAALRDSEERLDRAQRIAGIGSWEFDVKTGRRVWSKQMYRIRGILNDGEAPTIQGLEPFTHPDDRHKFYGWLEQLKAGIPQASIEYRISLPDGQQRVVVAEGEPVFDASGTCTKVAGTLRDVTELRLTEQKLAQAQKMETIGQLAGGMAHDFNNVLGVIIGNLDLLGYLTRGQPQAEELRLEVQEAALRGADLTRRLLAFARRQPLRPVIAQINDLVDGVAKLLVRILGQNVQLDLNLDPDLWPVVIDPNGLEAALANLATNARDAMPCGGRLIIATRNTTLDLAYAAQHPEVEPGDYVVIEVSDSGSGIPDEIVRHIFEPFFTTKDFGKGSGLGLPMVFGFIKQSGGHVSVYSELQLGSTFRLYLPRSLEAVVDPPVRDDTGVVPSGDETVLVVEDNAQLRRATVQALSAIGYHTLEAVDAANALTVLQERDDIDLLFTDVVMPGGMDGLELASRATVLRPELRVLLTSGFPDVRSASWNTATSDYRLLAKPYAHDELARVIREVLDGCSVVLAMVEDDQAS